MTSGRKKGQPTRKELVRLKLMQTLVSHYSTADAEVHDIYDMIPMFDVEKMQAEYHNLVVTCREKGWI